MGIQQKFKKEYAAWTTMKQRCYNPNWRDYHRYGGRGIKVCDRWKNSFINFIDEMGECEDGLSLEWTNNCVWATTYDQVRNRSQNRKIIYNNEEMCIKDFILGVLGISQVAFYAIRKKHGFTNQECVDYYITSIYPKLSYG
jgi:hypothetical protein